MSHKSNLHRRRILALAAIGCTAVIAACGTSTKPPSTTAPISSAQALNYTQCMRAHDVPNFPDPIPGHPGQYPDISPALTDSPAFQAAQAACAKILPANLHPSGFSASQKLAALRHAECMRAHGVPNYPDPTYDKNNAPIMQPLSNYGINEDSPGFLKALRACAGT